MNSLALTPEKAGMTVITLMPLLIGAVLLIAPLTRRRILMFSVRVPAGWAESNTARRIIRDYRRRVIFLSLIAAAISYCGVATQRAWPVVLSPFLLIVGAFGAVMLGRRATLPFATKQPVARSASLGPAEPPAPRSLHFLLPLAILGAVAGWLRTHWDSIPERFPIHWDLAGNPNGWSERTARGVYGPLVIGALICVVMMLTSFALAYGSPGIRGGNLADPKKTVRTATLRMFRGIAWMMAPMFAAIALAPLYPDNIRPAWLAPVIILASIALIVPVIRASSNAEGSEAERTPDEAWKFGIIYYNPGDPALMVEKRMGIGYTLNFGHPVSWVLTACLLAIPLGALLWNNLK